MAELEMAQHYSRWAQRLESGASLREIEDDLRLSKGFALPLEAQLLLQVVRSTGGIAARAFRRLAELENAKAGAAERIRIAEIAPRATARLMFWLPIAGLVLGQLCGLDLIGSLTSPPGTASFGIGMLLLLVARRWMRHIVLRTEVAGGDPGLALDLLEVGLASGEPVRSVWRRVERHLEDAQIEVDPEVRQRIESLVAFSRESGSAIAYLLRVAADEIRVAKMNQRLAEIESSSVRLTLPLGLVALPAFALMAVVPAAMATLRAGT